MENGRVEDCCSDIYHNRHDGKHLGIFRIPLATIEQFYPSNMKEDTANRNSNLVVYQQQDVLKGKFLQGMYPH